jgi:CDP-glucose 4,6-dehydratase
LGDRPGAVEGVGLSRAAPAREGGATRFWTDRPTLVTGATGFAGSWLVERLHGLGADLVCLVRDWSPQSNLVRTGLIDKVKRVRGDVCDQALVERVLGEYEVDTVFHLAAQTIVGIANRNPVSTLESNIGGTWSMLEACRRSPSVKHIVVASSDKAYGDAEGRYTEDTPLRGMHPYDVSKSCADLIAQAYAATYKLPVTITRCGNFYGGGDLNWNRIVPGTIRSVLRGKAPVIRSDGTPVRDYLYVEDGAAAYIELAEAMASNPELGGQAFNFSNESEITVLELTRLILGLMHSSLEPEIRNQATNEIAYQALNAAKARETLGWKPIFSLERAMGQTIEWYTKFFSDSPRELDKAEQLAG